MFGFNNKAAYTPEIVAHNMARPVVTHVTNNVWQEYELRPCWVRGQKAIFHRWINSAKPQLPRGEQPGENARYYQYRATQALVEFEDGTMERVWPTEVQFADNGKFREFNWEPMSQETAENERE